MRQMAMWRDNLRRGNFSDVFDTSQAWERRDKPKCIELLWGCEVVCRIPKNDDPYYDVYVNALVNLIAASPVLFGKLDAIERAACSLRACLDTDEQDEGVFYIQQLAKEGRQKAVGQIESEVSGE